MSRCTLLLLLLAACSCQCGLIPSNLNILPDLTSLANKVIGRTTTPLPTTSSSEAPANATAAPDLIDAAPPNATELAQNATEVPATTPSSLPVAEVSENATSLFL